MKKYTLWFYATDKETGKLTKQYDVFTGTRYQCYKERSYRKFQFQYKVEKAIWC